MTKKYAFSKDECTENTKYIPVIIQHQQYLYYDSPRPPMLDKVVQVKDFPHRSLQVILAIVWRNIYYR